MELGTGINAFIPRFADLGCSMASIEPDQSVCGVSQFVAKKPTVVRATIHNPFGQPVVAPMRTDVIESGGRPQPPLEEPLPLTPGIFQAFLAVSNPLRLKTDARLRVTLDPGNQISQQDPAKVKEEMLDVVVVSSWNRCTFRFAVQRQAGCVV